MEQTPYRYLEQTPYKCIEQSSYLKGLLKPFKGKGDYEILTEQIQTLREGIASIISEIHAMAFRPPYSLLNVTMRLQAAESGSTHLRWRSKDLERMGVEQWVLAMNDPMTPESLLDELHAMEVLRIQLNMQMSCLQFITRQARECAEKMDYADEVLSQAKKRFEK